MSASCMKLSGAQILEGLVGFMGTLSLMASVLTPHWYDGRGLWESDLFSNGTRASNQTPTVPTSRVRKAQLFFTGLSFIMAVASFCLCTIFLFCWRPPRHTQDNGQPPRPGSFLLVILLPTGVFFLLGWSIFTWQHWHNIQSYKTSLGYSYWLGTAAWSMLLVFLPAAYLVDECLPKTDQKPPPYV